MRHKTAARIAGQGPSSYEYQAGDRQGDVDDGRDHNKRKAMEARRAARCALLSLLPPSLITHSLTHPPSHFTSEFHRCSLCPPLALSPTVLGERAQRRGMQEPQNWHVMPHLCACACVVVACTPLMYMVHCSACTARYTLLGIHCSCTQHPPWHV